MESASALPQDLKPANVKELVKAWKVSGRKALVLETRLQRAVEMARRYRRDLLRLAEQNRSRKIQADGLQQKLLQLLEQRSPDSPKDAPLPELPSGDDSIPAEQFRNLLIRLREAHDLVAEFETLLEFREKQVHELMACQAEGEASQDWRLLTLQRELTEARHRIRLLTQELAQQGPASSGSGESSQRVAELEQQLADLSARGDQALQDQLRQREQQIGQLQEQVATRLDELKKAVATIHAARDRIHSLEKELEAAKQEPHHDEAGELLMEVTNLQDEIARVQEEGEALAAKNAALRVENEQLRAAVGGGDPQRTAKLEAAVVDLRQKLQLAGSKYQEVKAALIEKHQQLLQLQNRSVELEKSAELIQHGGRTLESALSESKRQNQLLQAQIETLRKAGAASGGAPVDESEALASMQNKLKEARRSAVRAQAEAGLKRKEMAKMQEEMAQLKAQVVQLGGTV